MTSHEICHGTCHVQNDRVGILDILGVDVLDEGAESAKISETWEINECEVEKVFLIDSQIDRAPADFASNSCQVLLLGVDNGSDVCQIDFFGIFLALVFSPDLGTLYILGISELHD